MRLTYLVTIRDTNGISNVYAYHTMNAHVLTLLEANNVYIIVFCVTSQILLV